MFYSLDGSAPSFAATYYSGHFSLKQSSTLRTIAYSADFFQAGEGPAIYFTVIPTYTLTTLTPGGGAVLLNPPTGPYQSNTVVNVTAYPAPGWSFLGRFGDLTGTSAITNVTMNRDKTVQAVFGTTLSTTVAGSGSTILAQLSPLYPFATVVWIAAVPQTGNYFGVWGNAANGNVNPLYFTVTNPNPTVSCLFAPLGGSQVALTVIPSGNGQVVIDPPANAYTLGASVTLRATPDAGQTFLGWTNDATGRINPLTVIMSQSKIIVAHFTKRPSLSAQRPLQGLCEDGFRFSLLGGFGDQYRIDVSTNLINWNPFATFTNTYGETQFTDTAGTNTNGRFYRGVQPP